MKRRALRSLFLGSTLLAAACHGSTPVKGGDAGVTGARPPSAGAPHAPDGTSSTTFAITKLYLGDTDADGTPDKTNGWTHFGYDIDGRISTATSTDLCSPRDNAATKNVYPDGNDGIDNSFGKNILPIILGIASDASSKINASIAGGTWTFLLDVQSLGTGASYNPLTTRAYAGAPLGSAPKFDGTDVWPVTHESLTSPPDLASAAVTFGSGYLVDDTWVSGPPAGQVTIALSLSGFTLPLVVHHAVITMELAADHRSATRGVLSGVLSTAELTETLRLVAGGFDTSLCSGPTIDSILTQITQASDILADGTQDPTRACDGISIGLGFDASRVELGSVADPVTPPASPCPP